MNINGKTLINSLVCLLLGGAIGFSAAHAGPHQCRPPWHSDKEGGKEQFLLRLFTKKLDLDADQQQKTKELLMRQGAKIRELFRKTRPDFEAIREEAKQEMRGYLREDQLDKFAALEKRMEEFREKHGSPGGDFPPHEKGL
ncbi:MAG: hypothetical protein KDD64_16145 [Bdellovibrionales bacterium]|nr:hypothetical protein [Bdellovibrionales bacterium]